jgi:beta-lactamase regulating signal transducer with metallopeptidase domain
MNPHLLSASVATATIAGLWQGAALSLLAAALLRLMPRASARLRHGTLLGIFVAAAVLPWIRLSHHVSVPSAAAIRVAPWFAMGIAALWLIAASIRGISLAVAWQHLRNVRRNARPVVLDGITDFAVGTRRAVLCTSSEVDTPAILGFFRPVLLLPEWLAPTLTSDELRQIATHECEHLRRRDDWVNLALQLGLVVSPLNPALLWLNRHIGIQRELACDAAVVAATAQPLAYAASLTRLAEQRMRRNGLVLALAALGRRSELAQRIHSLLREPSTWTARQSGMASGAAAIALLAASTGLVHAPRFIRVADAAVTSVSQPVATIVPATAMVPLPKATAPATGILPVTFHLPTKHPRKAKPRAQRADVVETHFHPQTPWLIRTSTQATPQFQQTTLWLDEVDSNDVPHLVPATLPTPYLAVPTRSGWLLIEL